MTELTIYIDAVTGNWGDPKELVKEGNGYINPNYGHEGLSDDLVILVMPEGMDASYIADLTDDQILEAGRVIEPGTCA
jgi:hypothetical protein